MFANVSLLFKNGRLVVQDGVVTERVAGLAQTVTPEYDSRINHIIKRYFDRFYSLKLSNYAIQEADFEYLNQARFHDIESVE